MKILNNLLNIAPQNHQSGSWGVQKRKRKGIHYTAEFYSGTMGGVDVARYQDRILSDSNLWTVYRRCADVRASIDSIVRRVATFDWMVVPKVSPQNQDYAQLAKICESVQQFLEKPNQNGDTWQEIMTAMLTDCLVFDSGVLELAYDRKGNLKELVPLRGCTIQPIIDEFGRIKHYEQNIYEEGNFFIQQTTPMAGDEINPKFKKKQIMYLSLFKNTAMPSGNPLLEALVDEVITLMRATEHAMLALDADEVPPGILVLAGIAGRAAEEAKADLQRLKGQDHKVRVMTTPDPQGMGAKWLELRKTPKDVQMSEIVEQIRRVIYRTFGVMPIEMGMTESMPRATATVQMDVASSHLVTPTLELLQGKINAQIIPAIVKSSELANLIEFRFDRESRLTTQEQMNLSTTYRAYITQGVMTRNEVRESLGLQPLTGGDVPTIEVAGQPMPLEAVVAAFDHENIEKNSNSLKDLIDDQASKLENEINKTTDNRNRSKFGIYGNPQDAKLIIQKLLSEKTPIEYNLDYPLIPYPTDKETITELFYLKSLIKERQPNYQFIKKADEDIQSVFFDEMKRLNLDINENIKKDINKIFEESSIIIIKLKYIYNRPRPYQVAIIENIDFNALDSDSAKTPAYPSGHTIQSILIANYLTAIYPEYGKEFFNISEKINHSRMVGGYHFPSDILFGKQIASIIIKENKYMENLSFFKSELQKKSKFGLKSNAKKAMDVLPKKIQSVLKEKGKKHNEEFGKDPKKKIPNINYLAVCYHRGIGAYNENPESVRPTVSSAEQWAYGRVNGYLYALEYGKFKRKPFDTDLLPKEHPYYDSKKSIVRDILNGFKDLPLAKKDEDWGFTEQEFQVLLSNNINLNKVFLFKIENNSSHSYVNYKLPIAKIVDGELKIIFRGVAAASSALNGSDKHNSGFYDLTKISNDDKIRLYEIIKDLYEKFNEQPPSSKLVKLAVGDIDPTNFPKAGEDLKVDLNNSRYELFPLKYAAMIKEKYPDVWALGGNIRGNHQYEILTRIVNENNGKPQTANQEEAIRRREAWMARHKQDFRIAGTIAQIKWLGIGDKGLEYMKDLVEKEIQKKYGDKL